MSLRPIFARAAAVMTKVGGEAVSYQFRQGGPALAVQVIFSQPEDADGMSFGRTGKSSVRVEAVVTAAALAPGRPERGDLIAIGSEKGWRVEAVTQDASEAFFTLGLVRQD
jgi:hypothetical protein